jgi:hypothetical protein
MSRFEAATDDDIRSPLPTRDVVEDFEESYKGITSIKSKKKKSKAKSYSLDMEAAESEKTECDLPNISTEEQIKAACRRLRELGAEKENLVRRLKKLFIDQQAEVKNEEENVKRRMEEAREERERIMRDFLLEAGEVPSLQGH